MDILKLKYSYDRPAEMEPIRKFFAANYPDIEVGDIEFWGSGHFFNQYYIQFKPMGYPKRAHFEYLADGTQGFLEFHLEPETEDKESLKKTGIRLMHDLSGEDIVCEPRSGIPFGCFKPDSGRHPIFNEADLFSRFKDLYGIIDRRMQELDRRIVEVNLEGSHTPDSSSPLLKRPVPDREEVKSSIMTLEEVMNLNLSLPEYQRDYCWEERNITDLWKNLPRLEKGKAFHLGTLIFHANKDRYDIIDGQQRLVTLSLILWGLGYRGNIPLLDAENAEYSSADAIENIGRAKFIIKSLVERLTDTREILSNMLNEISFAALVVNDSNLELAYTFFSNQNSKGVPLSDFDLLKAHHLRFIPFNDIGQAEHMAKKWNAVSQMPPVYREKNAVERVLGAHLLRLRKWMRKQNSSEQSYRYIQREFQAAPVMNDIPAFGEQFRFYEKIRGGTHFFVYVETFIHRYESFLRLEPVRLLHSHLADRRYEIFADTIETLLFAYYLKFGDQYLPEALFCISRLMALFRYNSYAVASNGVGVRNFANESEMVLMIDQAPSPTFFFAEILQKHEELTNTEFPIRTGLDLDEARGIRWGIYKALQTIFKILLPDISVNYFKRLIQEEYGK